MSVVLIVINPASIHCLLNGILSVSIYYVANIIIILAWMYVKSVNKGKPHYVQYLHWSILKLINSAFVQQVKFVFPSECIEFWCGDINSYIQRRVDLKLDDFYQN